MPIPHGGKLKTIDEEKDQEPNNGVAYKGNSTCGAIRNGTLVSGRVNDSRTVIGKRQVGAKKIHNGAQVALMNNPKTTGKAPEARVRHGLKSGLEIMMTWEDQLDIVTLLTPLALYSGYF